MVDARRAIADRYGERLVDLGLTLPSAREGGEHAYYLYVVRCDDAAQRSALSEHLARTGVGAAVHYPTPVHLQPAYADRVDARGLPNTEVIADQVLSLPVYPELTEAQEEAVIGGVRTFFGAAP
jgi:dTDP-4-amino-4,6-dideoxygalactose transaminase